MIPQYEVKKGKKKKSTYKCRDKNPKEKIMLVGQKKKKKNPLKF